MEPRFQQRKDQLLADCQVPPATFRGAMRRLETFAQPFIATLPSPESQVHARTYLSGLLSDVEHKNAEAIAYRHDLDRQTLQHFLGSSPWDHTPPVDELNRQVAGRLGRPDAVLVFDPSAFPKKGEASVGVQRQWCGRLGKVENCQVGVYLGYVTDIEHVLVDFRLYLPAEWAKDRRRRKKCGVPQEIRYRTRHQLALEMLQQRGGMLPHGGISGDDEMGRPAWFRKELAAQKERYLLAVPSNTGIRDLEAEPPPYGGQGRRPKPPFQAVRTWCEALPAEAWTRLTVRDGEKGPLEVEIVARRVESKVERRVVGFAETLVVVRYEEGGKRKTDYHLSNAARETSLAELARVAKAEHRIEECLKRGKSEAGLGDSQVRNWLGWHHHMTLSLLALWFLVGEAGRGKKGGAGVDRAASACRSSADLSQGVPVRYAGAQCPRTDAVAGTQRAGAVVPLQGT
ncbi:MAG: IS701 family transposase [Planctomycetaceae bacterium]|nr:IS701 family transposase [Planctomycetaceae bacterium]